MRRVERLQRLRNCQCSQTRTLQWLKYHPIDENQSSAKLTRPQTRSISPDTDERSREEEGNVGDGRKEKILGDLV